MQETLTLSVRASVARAEAAYVATAVEGALVVRTGQTLYCVRNETV